MINKESIYPVAFFVFKRPSSTLQFLNIIKKAGINKLYIFADGPRNKLEKVETDAVRANIDKFKLENPNIRVQAYHSEINLGLKQNIIQGLSKVFSIESAAIILEDDCLPTLDFFRFTREMLLKYKDDTRVMSITGTSVGVATDASYAFTKYTQCWGWASWARAWKLYDPTISKFNSSSWDVLADSLGLNHVMRLYFRTMLTVVKAGWIDTWDFQWSFAHFLNHGLAITPSANLITNIGFDNVATNTKTKTSAASMTTTALKFPLTHPLDVVENLDISHKIETSFYANPVAILGLLRQYVYWKWSIYANRH